VPSGITGLGLRDYPRLGGGRACNLDLAGVQLAADALLGDGSDALSKIECVVDRALAALGAEAVGIMQIMLDMTLDYTKIRKQFGGRWPPTRLFATGSPTWRCNATRRGR